jgi:mono/diheme cytochrome c family protein
MYPYHLFKATAIALALTFAVPARAGSPADFLASFETEARRDSPGFTAFSAQRGQAFFQQTHGHDWSCASCHTKNPAASGRHAKTDKIIAPLAPAANAERFTSTRKVEKWFRRNCNDVVGRTCTAQEKGDVLAYLMSIK